MKLIDRRRAANAAATELRLREHAWRHRTVALRAWCARHRAALIVGGGLGAGILASLVPVAAFVRLASMASGTASLLFKSPLAGFFAGYEAADAAEQGRTQ